MMVEGLVGDAEGAEAEGFIRALIDSPFDRTTFQGAMYPRLGQTLACLNTSSNWFDVTVTALNAGYSEPTR